MNGRMYMAAAIGLAVTDTGDFLQIRNASDRLVVIHEIRVYQTSDVTLAMNRIGFTRGVGGSGGDPRSEFEHDVSGGVAGAAVFSLPTSDVGTEDWGWAGGWNILQEFIYLPTPEMRISLANSDHLGVMLIDTDVLTIGCTITWEEIGT